MKWRNSILWQCRSRGSVLLRLPTDSSCEDRIRSCFHTQRREISICFHLTSASDCGMHFSEAFHTELRVLTLLFLNPVMTNPRFQGTSDIFLVWDSTFGLIFWSWEQIKFSVASVGVCSPSLKTWVCSEILFHETFPVMLGRGKGINHNSKMWHSKSLGYLGFILSGL